MKKFLYLILVSLPLLLAGKETKKIVRQNYFPSFTETYYVLKSDTNLMHGPYKAETSEHILVQGYFNMGKKDSTWIQYNNHGKIRYRGSYKSDKKAGVWEFFSDNGEMEQKLDFDNDCLLLYKTPFADHPFKVISGADTTMAVLDRPPLYFGGNSRFNDFISNSLTVPLHKADVKTTGIVYIQFQIDSMGIASKHQVLKGINKLCNDEALKAVKAVPNEWLPGLLKNKKVTADYIVPIRFDENTATSDF
jgi:hypothetical protein